VDIILLQKLKRHSISSLVYWTCLLSDIFFLEINEILNMYTFPTTKK